MRVMVAGVFESLVYHIHTYVAGPGSEYSSVEIQFLVWDPRHKSWDLVDAEQCTPLDLAAQPFRVTKQLQQDAEAKRHQELFAKDKAKQEHIRKRREEKGKSKE